MTSFGLLLVLNGLNCKTNPRCRIDLNGLNTSKALRPNQAVTFNVSSSVDVSGFSHLSILDLIAKLQIIKILNCLRGEKTPTKQKILMPLKLRQGLLGFLAVEGGKQGTRSIWKCKQSNVFAF